VQPIVSRTAGVLFVLYLLSVAWLTFQPSSSTAGWGVTNLTALLVNLDLPATIANAHRVEFLLNVVMLIPLPILGMLAWRRTNWRDWVAYAFLISTTIEVIQVPLPTRSATYSDVAANTAGALVGGLAMAVATVVWRGLRTPDPAADSRQ
jgi:glycopeptide antibiotics resistance protein